MNHLYSFCHSRRQAAALAVSLLLAPLTLTAQESTTDGSGQSVVVSGNIQSDILLPTGKQSDGSSEDLRTNSYAEVSVMSQYVDAGLRMEYLDHPLPGFEHDFAGWGLPFFYIKGKLNKAELTVGTFYEQFGSGFILRTYEERSLGVDNSLLGARLTVEPLKGVRLKALSGKQRRYWAHNDAWVSGTDMELHLSDWSKALQQAGTNMTLGASWVNKHEKTGGDRIMTDDYLLRLPENVNAFDLRMNLQQAAFSLLGEHAWKTQDPSFDNGYIYRPGYVAMLSSSYSRKGLSVLLQAKRSDNFSFRSRRTMNGISSMINHLPAFTEDHTYTLAALYPYATHNEGEWAYQGQFSYQFRRKTTLGGRYGMNVKLNFSHVHAIDQSPRVLTLADGTRHDGSGSDGYGSAFWRWGDATYYQDLNIQLERRLSKGVKLNLMYMNQRYNKTVVEGEGGMIHADIFVADALFNIAPKTRLRTELQYLSTSDDQGDWSFALAELSLAPHWMLTVSDLWNNGDTHAHYWQTYATYSIRAHRLQLGWGRTRAGFNCSGGVCRYIPETKGVTLSYNYNF